MIARAHRMQIGTADLCLPIYFPSISTVKTALPLLDYVRFLTALNKLNKHFLVSAYDLSTTDAAAQETLRDTLLHARAGGGVVLMDSGNYESFWKGSEASWNQASFHQALNRFPCDFAFGFDEQAPPTDRNGHLDLLLARLEQDQVAAGSTEIIPIIHGDPEELPYLCNAVANNSVVVMIAVPERKLGESIFTRAKTVSAIRRSLDHTGRYVGLHLLGTGNPISLALYSVCGADSFDGLEWCQVVVDHESGLLFHFSQADFFAAQTTWAKEMQSFQAQVLAHNLEFYTDWMYRLSASIHRGEGVEFCRVNFPQRIFAQCAAAMGWSTP